MLKFDQVVVTFAEVPEEVTLCIEITGCPVHCPDCHSKHLWEDYGKELTPNSLQDLLGANEGITCVAFMGGDASPEEIDLLAKWLKENTALKVCWYSGMQLRTDIPLEYFDYIKTGPYKKDLGGLDSITTNQRFYIKRTKWTVDHTQVLFYYLEDITYKFQKQEQ